MRIRTQNRRQSIPIDDLVISLDCRNLERILAYPPANGNENNCYELGVYTSEERVLQVLDEIQSAIQFNYEHGYSHSEIPHYRYDIFVMPLE